MRPNKLTPGSNIRWESSRMILPEHREQLLQYNQEKMKKTKPELDEQQITEIEHMLQQALQEGFAVEVMVFGEYADKVYQGYVRRVDPELQRIKLEILNGEETLAGKGVLAEEIEWVNFHDILVINSNR